MNIDYLRMNAERDTTLRRLKKQLNGWKEVLQTQTSPQIINLCKREIGEIEKQIEDREKTLSGYAYR
jgi:protein subunit release factor A